MNNKFHCHAQWARRELPSSRISSCASVLLGIRYFFKRAAKYKRKKKRRETEEKEDEMRKGGRKCNIVKSSDTEQLFSTKCDNKTYH